MWEKMKGGGRRTRSITEWDLILVYKYTPKKKEKRRQEEQKKKEEKSRGCRGYKNISRAMLPV
jgi:hypothetical protein